MRYIKLYWKLLYMNFSYLLIYRFNFFAGIISSLLWGGFSFVVMLLLTSRTGTIYGWTQQELLILTAVVNVFLGIYRMFFDGNMSRFSQVAYLGELDQVLIKPVDSQFQLSFWMFDFHSLARVFFFIILLFILLVMFQFPINFVNIFGMFIFGFIGISILYSLSYALLTLTIWFPRLSNLLALSDVSTGIMRYPKEIYQELGYLFFLFLPIALIINVPTNIILQKANISDVILLTIFSIIFFSFSRIFWKFALRHYSSASS